MSKKDELMKIVEQVLDLYPQLDVVMVDDVEEPTKFMMTTTKLAIEEGGLDEADIEHITVGSEDEEDSLDEYLARIEFDEDKDDDGGFFH